MSRLTSLSGILLALLILIALIAVFFGKPFPLFFRAGKIIFLLLLVALTPILLHWLRRE